MYKFNRFRLKKLFLLLFIFIITLYFLSDTCPDGLNLSWIVSPKISKESVQIECYDYKTRNVLQELVSSEVRRNSSIFFVETSCHGMNLNINPRQACAIESAVKMHPNFDVYLLIPSPIYRLDKVKEHFEVLNTYPNFKIRHINMTNFFIETPLKAWYNSGQLKSSLWPQSHTSDILRYTLLWKFGGIYMDLDVVILRSLEKITNFAGAESSTNVAAGVLSFSHNHEISWLTINDLKNNFRGYEWGWNGPGVMTRALKKYCKTCKVENMIENGCRDFSVFSLTAFYPIEWSQWNRYFTNDEEVSEKVLDEVKDSYAIHVWNKHSIKTKITIGSKQPYGIIAEKFCPKVYSSLKEFF